MALHVPVQIPGYYNTLESKARPWITTTFEQHISTVYQARSVITYSSARLHLGLLRADLFSPECGSLII